MVKPIVAVTMGDPAGVGPEVVLKGLADREVRREKGDANLFCGNLKESFHVTLSMASERCLSARTIKADASD